MYICYPIVEPQSNLLPYKVLGLLPCNHLVLAHQPQAMAAPAMSATTSVPHSFSTISQSEEDALKVAVFQRLHPRAYLERFLAENIRPDKRLCDGFRDVHVNVGEFFFFLFSFWRRAVPLFSIGFDCSNIGPSIMMILAMVEEVRFYLNCKWVSTCSNGKYDNRLWSQSRDIRT